MATEYKLSFTAAEVEERLKEIDNLAKDSDIPTKTSELANDSGFLTSIPSEYVTDTELNEKGYLTEHQSLADYAKTSDLGNLAVKDTVVKTDLSSDIQASLGKADSALQSYTETDPTVPSWAKASTKPSYTKSEIGLGNVDNVKQYSSENPPVVAQPEAPQDTSVIWVDTDDNNTDDATELINVALAQAKASGEFDGKDGYSPVKGADYWTPTDKTEIISELSETLQYVTPQMFGAKGDGITDDTEAFKKCFEHTNIFIPVGTYIISETIEVLNKTNICGNTRESTTIQSAAGLAFNAQGFVDLSNLRIKGNGENTGIQFPQHNLRLINVDFRDFNIGIISNGETTVKFNSLERCSFWGVEYPLQFNSATAQFNTTMILNCTFRDYICALTAPYIYSVKFDGCSFLNEKTDCYILDVQASVNIVFQSCYIETYGQLVSERWAHGSIIVKNTWIYTKYQFFHALESTYYRTIKFVESTIINSDSNEETFPVLINGTNLTVDLVECITALGVRNASQLTITSIDIAEQYGVATNCRINNGYLTLDTLPLYNGEVE